MGIGGSIFLMAVGAIIAFGVHAQVGFLDLSVVGWVLMVAGFAGVILTLWLWSGRRRQTVTQTTSADPRVAADPRMVADPRVASRETVHEETWGPR